MKYLIVVPDGAGDEPISELGGKTPLEVAEMTCINRLASRGEVGMVKTIPDGMMPGSETANMGLMGYDPAKYLTGRSPLEAMSMGIDMEASDVAFRANIVTLSGEGSYENLTMTDHSSGEITSEEAALLIESLNEELSNDDTRFYPGVSYRHCMIVKNGTTDTEMTPPHDILERRIGDFLPSGKGSIKLKEMMRKSYEILKNHPVNIKRIKEGKHPGNSLWFWGGGKRPSLDPFFDKYGLTGTAVSAVDLIKGIALFAGLDSVDVEGATGTLDTNYEGKKDAAINEFKRGKDFVYVHLEGPDECGHQADIEGKIEALQRIDKRIVKPIVDFLIDSGDKFNVMVVPDHRTPICIRTHSDPPVPFVIYRSYEEKPEDATKKFNEKSATQGKYFSEGYSLTDYFLQKDIIG